MPFGYLDDQTNQLVGFDVDICRAIAQRLGVDLVLKPVTTASRIPLLLENEVDIVAAALAHTVSRDEEIDFSVAYFSDGQRVLTPKGSGIADTSALDGRKIGAARGSAAEKTLKAARPGCTVLPFETLPQAFLALKAGKLDAVTGDYTVLLGLAAVDEQPGNWAIVGPALTRLPYAVGLAENQSDLRDEINKCLAELWTSGEYKKLFEKWFGPGSDYELPITWEMETWP